MAEYIQGFDEERFASKVDRNFLCLICFSVLRDPVLCSKNGHHFCRACIMRHLDNSRRCPTCADILTVRTLAEPPRMVKDYLNELNIHCVHKNRGCQEIVQLQYLERHETSCGFMPVVCSNQGCDVTVSKRDLIHHESEVCEFRKVKCHSCEEMSRTLAEMERRVERMERNLAVMDGNVAINMTSLKTNVSNVEKSVATNMRNVERNLVASMERSVATKVSGMEEKMATNLNNMEKTVTANIERNLATKVSDMEKKVATNVKNVERNVATKVSDMEKNLAASMVNMERNVTANIGRNVATKVSDMEKNMATNLKNMETNLAASIERNTAGSDGSQTALVEAFNEMKDVLVNVEDKIEENPRKRRRTVSGDRENIIVAGGWGTDSVEMFNWRQRTWSLLQSLPDQRAGATSFVYNNLVTVVGGYSSDSDYAYHTMLSVNLELQLGPLVRWIKCPVSIPAELNDHSSVLYDNRLIVAGGDTGDDTSDYIDEVQLAFPYTTKVLSRMPEPRQNHCMEIFEDSLLIVGGRTTDKHQDNLSSVVLYDMKKNECKQLVPLPYKVSEMATVKWGDNIVVIGGIAKRGNVLKTIVIYNIKTEQYRMLPQMKCKRRGCTAVVIGNNIVVLGGQDERGRVLKSVEAFNFDRNTWQELPEMSVARWLHTAVVV